MEEKQYIQPKNLISVDPAWGYIIFGIKGGDLVTLGMYHGGALSEQCSLSYIRGRDNEWDLKVTKMQVRKISEFLLQNDNREIGLYGNRGRKYGYIDDQRGSGANEEKSGQHMGKTITREIKKTNYHAKTRATTASLQVSGLTRRITNMEDAIFQQSNRSSNVVVFICDLLSAQSMMQLLRCM